ncbi:MAG TPA: sensor histidine kinase [Acidobacteriaceae bacterium]|jgi:signal transduction histidine kinase|nr:sensor histidine kinase [Acidobacteriaceae bacterium]
MNQLPDDWHKSSGDAQALFPGSLATCLHPTMDASLLEALQTELTAARRCCVAADMAAAIVHEIVQPLTAMVTNADAALLHLSTDRANLAVLRTILQQIQHDGQDASRTIRGLRALFKRQSLDPEQVDLPSVVRDVLLRLTPQISRHAVHTHVSMDAKVPPVAGDNLQLRQVLTNLIANAVESMQENAEWPRELSVRVSKEKRMVLTEIADRGHGITDCEAVFDAGVTTKEMGMGMGLRICRAIIEAHKGRLWARRRRDHGTVFTFSLPLAERAA